MNKKIKPEKENLKQTILNCEKISDILKDDISNIIDDKADLVEIYMLIYNYIEDSAIEAKDKNVLISIIESKLRSYRCYTNGDVGCPYATINCVEYTRYSEKETEITCDQIDFYLYGYNDADINPSKLYCPFVRQIGRYSKLHNK